MTTGSHVFVTMGDLTRVACDAWLLPTDRDRNLNSVWTQAIPALEDVVSRTYSYEFASGHRLAMQLAEWSDSAPLPVMTAVPFAGLTKAVNIRPAVKSFIQEATRALKTRPPRFKRPCHLLAVPLLGTGHGGGHHVSGEVIRHLLEEAREVAAQEEVDVVLVLRSAEGFALAQELRRQKSWNWWASLDHHLKDEAERLANEAKLGQLVPFMGSGVSISGGGPTWKQLIEHLAASVDIQGDELEKLQKRDVLDQASILRILYDEKRPDGQTLIDAVSARLCLKRYGLAPALLASLRPQQAITLNYDKLYEMASDDIKHALSVIPGDERARRDGWLLKLHGSVSEPDSIVLTRDDYLGYKTSREALSALVKANLITRHLLFVGFGLDDDHFHEILHDVMKALPQQPGYQSLLATALTLSRDELDERAWQHKLTLIPMSNASTSPEDAARTLEIFLDALLAYATDSRSYLLAEGYEGVLTSSEQSMRQKLLGLHSKLTHDEISSSGGTHFVQMLKSLGFDR